MGTLKCIESTHLTDTKICADSDNIIITIDYNNRQIHASVSVNNHEYGLFVDRNKFKTNLWSAGSVCLTRISFETRPGKVCELRAALVGTRILKPNKTKKTFWGNCVFYNRDRY